MIKNECVVGQRVIIGEGEHHELIGKTGTVVIIEEDVAGIELDEMLYLHDCNGKCKNGHGWYSEFAVITPENTSKLCRMMVKDVDLINAIRTNTAIVVNGTVYQKKENGALTMFTKDDNKKVLVINRTVEMPLVLNCANQEDRKLINHVLEMYNIAKCKCINEELQFVDYTEEQEKALEEILFATEVVPPVEALVLPDLVVGDAPLKKKQIVQSEAELYASLGIQVTV